MFHVKHSPYLQRGGPGVHAWEEAPLLLICILVAIFSMQWHTIAGMNTFDHAMSARDFEVAIRFDSHSPHIGADLFPFGDDRANQIACSEAPHAAWPLGTPHREPVSIDIDHATPLATRGPDEPRAYHVQMQLLGGRAAAAGCI